VVLLALAVFYTVLVFQYDYNLWEGPNFGMFATAEGPETRLIRCIVVTDGTGTPVECPEALAPAMIRLKGIPTDANLEVVGEQFARRVGRSDASAVRVEVWQFRYDAEGAQARFDRRLAESFDVEGASP
jgi:hypothetical protein